MKKALKTDSYLPRLKVHPVNIYKSTITSKEQEYKKDGQEKRGTEKEKGIGEFIKKISFCYCEYLLSFNNVINNFLNKFEK